MSRLIALALVMCLSSPVLAVEAAPEAFSSLAKRTYGEQAQFYMNAFWTERAPDGEKVWQAGSNFEKFDKENGGQLDAAQAHIALGAMGSAQTAIEESKSLNEMDADKNGKYSLVEYLAWSYKTAPVKVMAQPQPAAVKVNAYKAVEALRGAKNNCSAKPEDVTAAEALALAEVKALQKSGNRGAHWWFDHKLQKYKAMTQAKLGTGGEGTKAKATCPKPR